MADNYLERQRELYEIRKAQWEKTKKYPKKTKQKTQKDTSASDCVDSKK